MAGRIGILTGLAFEADLVRKLSKKLSWGTGSPEVRCIGMGGAGAGSAVQDLAALKVERLVSFGLAGGLDPTLKPGALVVPRAILDGTGKSFAVDEAWRSQFLERLGSERQALDGTLLSGAGLLTTKDAKQDAFQRSGGLAADMESAEIAIAAEAAEMPFLVLRAVADDAGTTLPPAAGAMSPGGRLSAWRVMGSLARRPWQLPALIALGGKTRTAMSTLEAALPRLMET